MPSSADKRTIGSAREEPDFVSQQTQEAKRYYLDLNPDPEQPLAVACGGVERTREDYVVERRDFPYFAIELVAEGRGRLQLDGQPFDLASGVVFSYGPGVGHRIENISPGGMRKYYVDFVGAEAQALLVDAGLGAGKPMLVSRIPEFTELMELIDREAREDSQLSQAVCASLLRILLLKLKQRRIADGSEVPTAYQTYESARRCIERSYLSVMKIEEVAAVCQVTPVYLSRLFNKFAGTGAYRFLLRLKMSHAAELLLEEGMMVKEVAELLGYADAFQFSRAFKRIYGVSPKKLVQSVHRRGQEEGG